MNKSVHNSVMKKTLFIITILVAIACAFASFKIRANNSALTDNAKQQDPHLVIITTDPIVATSWFKVSAVAPHDFRRGPVPFIRIIRKSDGVYMGGKALKTAFNTEYSMHAPSREGEYVLQLEGIEQEFTVHPIIVILDLEDKSVLAGETFQLSLETNTNGHQSLTLEDKQDNLLKTIRHGYHGADQDFLSGRIQITAPNIPGQYKLVYRNALKEETAHISFQVVTS